MRPAGRLAAAIEILQAIDESGRPADRILDRYIRDRRFIGGGDRSAIAARVWGIFRRRARLDWWIKKAGKGIGRNARGRVLADLVLHDRQDVSGIAEMFDGSRHAPDALEKAESEALRRIVGNDLDSPEMPEAVRAECPAWLWPYMQTRFGDEAAAALAGLGREAPFDLRVNPLAGLGRDAVVASLAEEQIPAELTALSPVGLRLDRRRPVDRMAVFKSGAVEVQDEGSQIAALLTGAGPGMLAIDYCAGAGGKALALAAGMENKGRLILFDVSKGRLDRAAVRLRRAGVHNAERKVLAEGDKSLKRLAGKADRVLVDAPCSGTGTWRRNPDAKWRYGADDLAELTKTQRSILERAASLVKPGGRVIYVTCSVLRAENEDVVDGFLAESDRFSVLPVAGVWAETVGDTLCPASGPYLTLAPHRDGTDGFFVAVLERARQP